MRIGVLWKALAALGLLLIVGTAAAITYFNQTRPQALGLVTATPRTEAPSPSPDDPLAQVCRRPAVPGNATSTGVRGLWVIQPRSIAGYRAREQFAELTSPHEAVARTDRLSGWLLVGGTDVSLEVVTGCIVVDVRGLRSVDELPGLNTSDRDETARDRLGARTHPFVVFQPYPAALKLSPTTDVVQRATLAGDLEISGVTKPASFGLDVRLNDRQVTAAGHATVQVDEFGVQLPELGNGFVEVNPNITLEVSLILLKA